MADHPVPTSAHPGVYAVEHAVKRRLLRFLQRPLLAVGPEWFPDLSEFNGVVDWNALGAAHAAGSISGVAIRAGFGTVRADRQFSANQAGARSHGIPAIYYWFNYPTYNTPQAEAAKFNSVVGPLGPGEAQCGDFEDDAPASIFPRGQAGADWAKAFLTALEAPQNASWWYTYPFLLSVIPFQELYGVWPFWLADYSATPDSAFTAPIARQFTDCGSTPGVSGCCDQSRVLKAPLSQWLTGGPEVLDPNDPIVQRLLAAVDKVNQLWQDTSATVDPVGHGTVGQVLLDIWTATRAGGALTPAQDQKLSDLLATVQRIEAALKGA